MISILDQLQEVETLVRLKHQMGRHDQKRHAGDKVSSYTVADPRGDEHTIYALKPGDDIASDQFNKPEVSLVYNSGTNTWHVGKDPGTMHETVVDGVNENDEVKFQHDRLETLIRGELDTKTGEIKLYDLTSVIPDVVGPAKQRRVAKKHDRALTKAFDNAFSVDGKTMNTVSSIPWWL